MSLQVLELIEQARLTLIGELERHPSYRALKALDRSLGELRAILGSESVAAGQERSLALAPTPDATQDMLESIAERAVQSVTGRNMANPFAQAPRVAQVARV
jgi:hypothetical protein